MIGQRNNELWGQYRKLQLTGSNFGDVIKAYKRKFESSKPIPPSLLKQLRGEYAMGKRDSIMWGQMHQETALKRYINETGNVVEQCGLLLFPCGFLGSSPDGIISEQDGLAANAPSMKKQKTAAGVRDADHDSSLQLLKSDDPRDTLEDLSENFDVFGIESGSKFSDYQMLDTMENDSTPAYRHEKSLAPSFSATASTLMGDFKIGKIRFLLMEQHSCQSFKSDFQEMRFLE
eukprot:gene14936-6079_t